MSELEELRERVEALEARIADGDDEPTVEKLSDLRTRDDKLAFIKEHGLERYLELVHAST